MAQHRAARAQRILDVQKQLYQIEEWKLAQLQHRLADLEREQHELIGALNTDAALQGLFIDAMARRLRSLADAAARFERDRAAQALRVQQAGARVALAGRLAAFAIASDQRMPWSQLRRSLPDPAYRALALWLVGAVAVMATWAALTQKSTLTALWTKGEVATALASEDEVRQRRKPDPDALIQVGRYVVDRRPADLLEGRYDWQSKRYPRVAFLLGRLETPQGPIDVRVHLDALGQRGLAYLCDQPEEGKLTPCSVAKRDQAKQYDAKAIWVGLYQGEAEIGRLGRPFMISCRYGVGVCVLEFLPPWLDGVRVVITFDKKNREQWADIVRFAVPRIESLLQRAGPSQPEAR
jgi:hypothetical protein